MRERPPGTGLKEQLATKCTADVTLDAAQMGAQGKVLSGAHVCLLFLGLLCRDVVPLKARNVTTPRMDSIKCARSWNPLPLPTVTLDPLLFRLTSICASASQVHFSVETWTGSRASLCLHLMCSMAHGPDTALHTCPWPLETV